MKILTEGEFLAALHEAGASRLESVRYRANRRTIWSITGGGRILNLHVGYRDASPELIHHFEVIVANPRGPVSAPARQAVLHYPPLQRALAEIRAMPARRSGRNGGGLNGLNGLNGRNGRGAGNGRPGRAREVGPNCATPGQQAYLEALYAFLNRTRFDDRLPSDIPLRLSSRMKSTYGWVMLQRRNGKRTIGELALNLDLMLEENDAKRLDIMLHEMAHIAAWLLHGERGHGAVWKRIARGLGCEPRACTRQKIQKRSASRTRISRVPPLPDSRPRQ